MPRMCIFLKGLANQWRGKKIKISLKTSQTSNRFRFGAEIRDPSRSYGSARILLILLITGLAMTQVLTGHPWGTWVFCAAVLILPLAIRSGSIYTVHFNILLLLNFLTDLYPHLPGYPFSRLTHLVLYGYAVAMIPALRGTVGWVRLGKMTGKIWFASATVVCLGVLILVVWARENSTDFSRYANLLPNALIGVLLLYGVAFAAFNAALEEIIWRGVMMEALDSAFGAGYCSVIIQAASFGVAHYRAGFPNKLSGAMLTFLGGLILGLIRRKSRGLFGSWLVHFIGDMTAFSLILFYVYKSGK